MPTQLTMHQIQQQLRLTINCEDCDLCKTRKQIVWGIGPTETPLMFIAEAPGKHEDEEGYPLVEWAKSGEEYTHLLAINGLSRDNAYITNMLKCRPLGDKDPKPAQIEACSKWLRMELQTVKPRIIGTIGRFSTQHFLGNVDMERVHGIPFKIAPLIGKEDIIIIPLYHPAAGLRDPNIMMRVQSDFKMFADVAKGRCAPRYLEDPLAGKEDYYEVIAPALIDSFLQSAMYSSNIVIAVDTESTEGDKLWSVQLSINSGEAILVMADNTEGMAVIAKHLAKPDVLTLLHNALHDLPQLAQAEIYPAKPACSMLMAYLLQSEPQGLKPLAYRHAGMEMKSYKEMIRDASEKKAMDYLWETIIHDWPKPDPVLEWKKDKPHVKQPQNIKKKAQRIIDDFKSPKKECDPRKRWHHIEPEEGRGMVEDLLDPMPEAYLSDIDHDEAVHYAGRDPDATLRIYPYLWEAIQTQGLEPTFWRDMHAMPMVVDMMQTGIKANPEYLKGLSKYFGTRMREIERDITHETGQSLNVASFDQVAKLLFDRLKIPKIRGRSTDASVLARSVGAHPVVQMIRDWRSYQKLKTTYADQIPEKIQSDGRVHATFRMTRTSTGRLSSANPNLQAQPVKGEEGPKIRQGFVASDGCYIVSNDYSQIEMRITAHDSRDSAMIKIFRDDGDIHTITAASIWGVPERDVDEMKHRYPIKRVGFGIIYGITEYGLYRTFQQEGITQWSQDDCKRIIDEWFKVYPGVKEYMKQVKLHARRYGYVRDLWGRIRYIPGVRAANKRVQDEALRMAGNAPIQMGAQGVIKQAMGNLVEIYEMFRPAGVLNPLIQIHDDLVWEQSQSLFLMVNPIICEVMENAVELCVPVKVDTKYGGTWGTMEKWKKEDK